MQAMEAQATLKISSSFDAHGLVKEENSTPESIHHQKSGDEDAKLDEVGLTKTEMGKVREENERLKKMLKQIEKDYQSLQMRFFNILDQQEACKISKDSAASHRDNEEPGFVSLCLGRSTNEPKRDDTTSTTNSSKAKEEQLLNENLSLGLDLKFQVSKPNPMEMEGMNSSQENSFEEQKDVAGETWPPNNGSKVMKNGDDEVSQQNNAKRARVSVRARCDTPTMNDGCQWRKYGQKTAKGNPCPRAYYRCTGAPACPVRKQVQRSAEDMSILITTYEGAHNHQLSVSATAMASTTSAAASMLISGSSTSQSDLSALATHGLNFNHYDNSRQRQFYIPNSSTAAYQTVTLDLTTSLSSSSTLFNRLISNSRTLPSTSVSFASSESNNILPTLWGNSYLNHGSTIPYNNTLNRGRQSLEHLFQPYMEQKQAPSHQFLTETLTKAITSDPSFRSVIATAISSMVGGSGTKGNQGGGESVSQNLKWSEPIPANNSPNLLTHKVKGCASTYLDRTSSSNSQTGSLMFLQPPSSCTISKNPSTDKENQSN